MANRLSRRRFLGRAASGLAGAAVFAPRGAAGSEALPPASPAAARMVKPPRLRRGDLVGIVNPSGTPADAAALDAVEQTFGRLGLRTRPAPHVAAPRCPDAERAADVNAMFADPEVKAVLPLRGGWGCARLLQHLDYPAIARHPKVLMGYSDVAALLLGIHARTGLVTFHGPMGTSAWAPFSIDWIERVLFGAEAARLASPPPRASAITPGRARGPLIGGNLTVLTSMVGSPYLRGLDGAILFLEEVREPISEVDRMLTQLALAGLLQRIRGFVFGECTRCLPPELDGTLTLSDVLADHVRPLGIPAFQGALIGHVDRQFTLPIGLPVEIDASAGTIQLLESAVA